MGGYALFTPMAVPDNFAATREISIGDAGTILSRDNLFEFVLYTVI